MNISGGFSKRTILLLGLLLIIGGGAAAYFLYFQDIGVAPSPEPEKVAKRIKIEVPAPPPEEKKEVAAPVGVQTQQLQPPAGIQPAQQPAPVQQGAVKPAEVKPEVAKKEEIKPAVKEVLPEKKAAVKKEKQGLVAVKTQYKPWALHVASHASKEEAQTMIKRLKKDKYNAYLTEFNLKNRRWYRVRVGFYTSEEEAKAVGKKITSKYNINGIWAVKPMKSEIKTHMDPVTPTS